MSDFVPTEIAAQVSLAMDAITSHLGAALLSVHLYGSAVDGGLKPLSDVDLLVVLAAEPAEPVKRALMLALLDVSAPPGTDKKLRSLEITAVVRGDIVPWRYPPRRVLQYGEWLRTDILAGKVLPAVIDPDLAILITQARLHGVALTGPAAAEFFDVVPERDFYAVLADSLALWNSPSDWAGDERNIILTLARIWFSAASGNIAPKDVAADWAIARLPREHRPILSEARDAYRGLCADRLTLSGDPVTALINHIKDEIRNTLGQRRG